MSAASKIHMQYARTVHLYLFCDDIVFVCVRVWCGTVCVGEYVNAACRIGAFLSGRVIGGVDIRGWLWKGRYVYVYVCAIHVCILMCMCRCVRTYVYVYV